MAAVLSVHRSGVQYSSTEFLGLEFTICLDEIYLGIGRCPPRQMEISQANLHGIFLRLSIKRLSNLPDREFPVINIYVLE